MITGENRAYSTQSAPNLRVIIVLHGYAKRVNLSRAFPASFRCVCRHLCPFRAGNAPNPDRQVQPRDVMVKKELMYAFLTSILN